MNNFLEKGTFFIKNEVNYFSQVENGTIIYIILLMVLIFYIFNLFKGKIYLFALITLPATFFHELSHFIVSLITGGMPRGFSIWPKKLKGGGYTLGYVESYNVTWFNGFLIGLAPLLLIPISYIFFKYNVIHETSYINLSWKLYLVASLLEGSIPSSTDFILALKKSFVILWVILIIIAFMNLKP